ncbi:MAG: extracellular solute-binding protein [Clostridiales bacterium]|nr:extracellular solute-binding protein [Clostridiales bacterium]
MKKLISMLLVLAMVFALSSLAVAAEKPVVNFWTTGSQNVADLFSELIAAYNAREDATAEVKLQFLLSGTGDEGMTSRVSSAFLSGQKNTEFDMISDNTNSLMNYVDECGTDEIFVDLDFSKLPNFENVLLKPSMLEGKVMPYRGTTVVFAYDSARIPENELPHTWDELTQWIKDHPGRFAYNEPGTGGAADGFMRTAVYRFIDDPAARRSSDEKWAEEWDKGMEWLADIHPFLYKSGGSVVYVAKNQGTLDLLINQEVDLIPAWADQVLKNIENGTLPTTVKMYQLDDGALSGTDVSITISSIGTYVDECYDFMNFVISPEGQKICLENMKAVPVIAAESIESEQKDLVADLNVENFAFLSIGSLSDLINERWAEDITTLK